MPTPLINGQTQSTHLVTCASSSVRLILDLCVMRRRTILTGLNRCERQRGSFSRGSRAFLHFHEDSGDFYVDVRLDATFQRLKVTSAREQAGFISNVRRALGPAA